MGRSTSRCCAPWWRTGALWCRCTPSSRSSGGQQALFRFQTEIYDFFSNLNAWAAQAGAGRAGVRRCCAAGCAPSCGPPALRLRRQACAVLPLLHWQPWQQRGSRCRRMVDAWLPCRQIWPLLLRRARAWHPPRQTAPPCLTVMAAPALPAGCATWSWCGCCPARTTRSTRPASTRAPAAASRTAPRRAACAPSRTTARTCASRRRGAPAWLRLLLNGAGPDESPWCVQPQAKTTQA